MKEYHVLNLGAGVQSSVLFLMLPHLTHAIFADTQEEPEAVYEHLKWLRAQRPELEILTPTAGRLGDDLKYGRHQAGKSCASMPVFTLNEKGKIGRVRRQCTAEYKIHPIERVIRRGIIGMKPGKRISIKDVHVHQYIGISTDEISRSLSIRLRFSEVKWSSVHFPLLDRGMSRADCIAWLKDYGIPHNPPRSACVFCPYHDNKEWLRLKTEDPTAFARAVEIDESLRIPGNVVNRKMDSQMFLHQTCRPLKEIDFSESIKEEGNMQGECEGMCGH